MSNQTATPRYTGLEIAVIGMAGRFPGAPDIGQLWENIKNGVESVETISDDELRAGGIHQNLISHPGYVKMRTQSLDHIDCFDASFFDYSPLEAEMMDPQMRILHETAWEALEDAAYDTTAYKGQIGLYAGSSFNLQWEMLARLSGKIPLLGDLPALHLINKDFMMTRVSYKLGLRGPSISVQTACSTSLVAIHMACRALLTGECQMALAGGITVDCKKNLGYLYQDGSAYSSDGHIKAFALEADGTVFGSGSGMIVLKPLKTAIADRDHIHAIIKGSAINNDGVRKVGYTAPSVIGQAEVIRSALLFSRVESESIGYIEAHGTGTALGDPIEFEGLKKAFASDKRGFCALGTVKANFGHLDSAAGVVGAISAILSLKHKMLPPRLNYISPNPALDMENSPFYINQSVKQWKNDRYPLRAGVSAFGIGGTNAHVIFEEAPQPEPPKHTRNHRSAQIILLSAKSEAALERSAENLALFLAKNHKINFQDLAYTLQIGRQALPHRAMVVCSDVMETIQNLPPIGFPYTAHFTKKNQPVVFLFSGQGSQYVNMGRGLYIEEPVFREHVDRCFDILEPMTGVDLRSMIFPDNDIEAAEEKIRSIEFSGPIKFALEYAAAKLLMHWGIKPYAMMGHSFGEYILAHLAGVFSLEDALSMVVLRGKLMEEQLPIGAMTTVKLPEEELIPLLEGHDDLSISVVNSPNLCFVSGPVEAIATFEDQLKKSRHRFLRVNVNRAGHCKWVQPMVEAFEKHFRQVKLSKPTIRYISGITGTWMTDEDALDYTYWTRHLLEPVRFYDGIKELLKIPGTAFIQVGSGREIAAYVNQSVEPDKRVQTITVNLIRHQKDNIPDMKYLLTIIGELWLKGIEIDWHAFREGQMRSRIPLPTYPFERTRYWLDIQPTDRQNDLVDPSAFTSFSQPHRTAPTQKKATQKRKPGLPPYKEPFTDLEKSMVEVWEQLFGIQPIGIDDDFFALGGDSMKAINFSAYILKALSIDIPLKEFFNRPTIAQMVRFIEGDSKDDHAISFSPIEKIETRDYYPLSSAQKRVFILNQLDKESLNYNIPQTVILEGKVDIEKLETIFRQMIQRHESFRTSFTMSEEGDPLQHIHSDFHFEIERYTALNGGEDEIQAILNQAVRSFDLTQPPLFRIGLIQLEEERFILITDMHHIISDGMSFNVMINDLTTLYRGDSLPPLSIQYKDYTFWQAREKNSDRLKEQEQFWLKEFAEEIPELHLPTDFPRTRAQRYEGRNIDFDLDGGTTQALKEMASQSGTTLYMVLMAIYSTFLSKIGRQENIVIGSPISGRNHADLEQIIGMFVNTLSIRTYPAASKRFDDYLQEIKTKTLNVFQNQEYQYEDLVDQVAVRSDSGRNPLFDTMLVLQNTGVVEIDLPGLTLKPYRYRGNTTKFDLSLMGVEISEKLCFTLEYSTTLFKLQTIERFRDYFLNILNRVLEDHTQLLSELEIISEAEKKQVLFDFNNTQKQEQNNRTIHGIFEDQARRNPGQIAVIGSSFLAADSPPVNMTYRELSEKSGQLAHSLVNNGILPGSIIAIMLPRSVEMIIGFLGILKAGCAYLPIDPNYPTERIEYMMADSGSRFILNRETFSQLLETPVSATLPEVEPHHLAYVIYTSGSTGKPKGVLLEHKGIGNLIEFHRNAFHISPADHIVQFASSSFDASVWEIYMTLLNGASLYLLSEEIIANFEKFQLFLNDNTITVATLPPEYAVNLVPDQLVSMRLLITAGSAPTIEMIDHFRKKLTYVNAYGPTETTVCASYEIIPSDSELETITIGKPLPNTSVYILDSNLKPQPIGIPGQLYLHGINLARGYLNRPQLTSEKFISPQNDRLPSPIYKTGDLARWTSDGKIEFLGRIDYQVKVRGFRIELEEIERHLSLYDSIKNVAVIVANENQNTNLCAYFQADKTIDMSQLRDYLSKKLPNYMIPSYFRQLELLPTTISGKIDRKALAELPREIESGSDYVAPQSDKEKLIADIWAEVLGVENVGIHDNYFNVGGNSLNLIKLNKKINLALGKEIPTAVFFEHITIDSFVRYLNTMETEENPLEKAVDRTSNLSDVRESRRRRKERRR